MEKTLQNVLDDIFSFSRDNVQQFFIINMKSENVAEPVGTMELESVIDEICKVHTEATVGTDEFVNKEVDYVNVARQEYSILNLTHSAPLFTSGKKDLGHLWPTL